jgi:hypothetical protein
LSQELSRNEWSVILNLDGVVELTWLPSSSTMTDGGVMAVLCQLALEAERTRPRGLLIDAREFRHSFSPGLTAWRDAQVVPRYGAAGVRRFAFLMPPGFPKAGTEAVEENAVFKTRWFVDRTEAVGWASAK